MMINRQLNRQLADKIDRCIGGNIPFALVFMPRKTTGQWYSEAGDPSSGCSISIKGFDRDSEVLTLYLDTSVNVSLDAAGTGRPPMIEPVKDSTQYDEYICQLHKIIETLRQTGGKTVLSRIIAAGSSRPITEVIDQYFDKFIDTMRFVYLLPQTGLWFGASPELLIDYDVAAQTLSTMSLAGTRQVQAHATVPWDKKNIAEHQFVTDHIMGILHAYGMEAEITSSDPLRFGEIEHLCDRITAHGDVDPVSLVNALSPTPALCGTPTDQAYRQIAATETHRRHCYGGWIGISTPERFTAYVNLRCAFAAALPQGGYRYNVYVGGGITADSDPQAEWQETQDKASALLSVL